MVFRLRNYIRLDEAAQRWGVSKEDILDCAIREMIALSVLVCNVSLIFGEYKLGSDGKPFPVHADRVIHSGLQRLTPDGLFRIRQEEAAKIDCFMPFNDYQYVQVAEDTGDLYFKIDDLVIEVDEYKRFAAEHGLDDEIATNDNHASFLQENNFRIVRLNGLSWNLGDIQAQVVQKLYEAATTTDNPWMNGKRVLQEAGSGAFRMRDLFGSQPNWQKLILSDGRGHYRLNLSDMP